MEVKDIGMSVPFSYQINPQMGEAFRVSLYTEFPTITQSFHDYRDPKLVIRRLV